MFKLFKLNEKGVVHLIPLLLLFAGIIAGVYLVIEGPKIFKPKATSESIEFLTSSCSTLKEGKKALSCPTVKFKLISPLETGNAQDEAKSSFNLVKTAFAAGSGEGYYCKEDKSWIYYKKCELIFNFLCSLPWWEDQLKEKEESCGDLRCVPTSADLFKQSAACAVVAESSARTTFQPVVSDQVTTPKLPEPTLPPRRAADLLPTTPARVTITPTPTTRAVSSPTPTPTSFQASTTTPTPTAAATVTPTPTSLTPTPTPAKERKTLKYRFAENPTDLKKAQWRIYEAGGVEVVYDFSDPKPDIKSIYAQFLDNQEPGQIIRFSDGLDYVVRNIELIPSVTPSPTAGPTTTPKATDTPVPVAVSCKVKEPARNCTLPSVEKCNIVTLADIGNCTNEQLLVTLTKEQLGSLPLERIKTFGSDDLMCFFPRNVVVRLDAKILSDLPNEDLLLLGEASGDCRQFLSNFSCDRIILLPKQYQDLTSCGR